MSYTPNYAPASVKIVRDNTRSVNSLILDRVDSIVRGTAEEVASLAIQFAPKGKRKRSKSQKGVPRLHKTIFVDQAGGVYRVRVTAPHAWYVEYGTRNMAATPYLRPAINAVKGRISLRLGHAQKGLGADLGLSTRLTRRR